MNRPEQDRMVMEPHLQGFGKRKRFIGQRQPNLVPWIQNVTPLKLLDRCGFGEIRPFISEVNILAPSELAGVGRDGY